MCVFLGLMSNIICQNEAIAVKSHSGDCAEKNYAKH